MWAFVNYAAHSLSVLHPFCIYPSTLIAFHQAPPPFSFFVHLKSNYVFDVFCLILTYRFSSDWTRTAVFPKYITQEKYHSIKEHKLRHPTHKHFSVYMDWKKMKICSNTQADAFHLEVRVFGACEEDEIKKVGEKDEWDWLKGWDEKLFTI